MKIMNMVSLSPKASYWNVMTQNDNNICDEMKSDD